jgi:NADH:ubiquinone oxidoreductase subunit 2 (subunit N)
VLCNIAFAYAKKNFLAHLEFVIIFLIAVQGMLLMISSNDLFVTFLCVELQAFCFYILTGLRHSNISAEQRCVILFLVF